MNSSIRLPNESASYRTARNELLRAELDLKKMTEQVAALRRRLPLGGEVEQDYPFDEGASEPARLSQLFADKSTLVLYSFMYGPAMKAACPLCTSFLDGLDGQAHHIRQQVALAVTAKSPIGRLREFAQARGWRRLRLVSSAGTSYQRDYLAESEAGDQWPMMNVFVKRDGKIYHHWASEMFQASNRTEDQIDARHIDSMWPLWNVLDLTPEGRGATWYPALKYADE